MLVEAVKTRLERRRHSYTRNDTNFVPHRLETLNGHLRFLSFVKATRTTSTWCDSDNQLWRYDNGRWYRVSI